MIRDEDRCPSLRKRILHREGEHSHEVYLRCKAGADHEGKHRSWLCKWTDAEEDGWIETEEVILGDLGL